MLPLNAHKEQPSNVGIQGTQGLVTTARRVIAFVIEALMGNLESANRTAWCASTQ